MNGSISTWDDSGEEAEFNNPSQLEKDGKNWKCELTESGRNEFVVRINRNGKDITTPAKFQFSMKDVKTNKIYFDKNTTNEVSGDFLIFRRSKDNGGRDIEFPKGETDLEFTIYYEDEVVETCHIIVTRK